jgi:hypothetical protein
MGVQKKKEAETARWKKVLIVGACVLFVVLMIVSGMGSGWLTMFSSVKPGDAVVVDYTIYNSAGNPIVTTDQQVYKTALAARQSPLATKQISLVANETLGKSLFPVQVYTTNGASPQQFALFATEYDAITHGLVGMKTNEVKKITLPASSSMSQLWSVDQLSHNNINMTDVSVGDVFAMAVSENPNETISNSSVSYLRVGEITRKTPAGIVVDFGYPSVDIRVVSIAKDQ